MVCEKCNEPLKDGDVKCSKCGTEVNKKEENGIKNKYYNAIDDVLIREYMGEKADTFLYPGLSIRNFILLLLFGGVYLSYRKMYFYGFIWILISVALFVIPGIREYMVIFSLLLTIFFTFIFKSMYLAQAKDKIEKIKKNNKTASNDELKRKARVVGGTNYIFKVLMYLMALCYVCYACYLIYMFFESRGINGDIDILINKWR